MSAATEYQVDVWFSFKVWADTPEDAREIAAEEVRNYSPASIEAVPAKVKP